MKKPPPIVDLSNLPAVLLMKDMTALHRISYSKLRRELQNGTFSPRPFMWSPARWNRDEVLADMQRRRPEPPGPRLTGFALKAKGPTPGGSTPSGSTPGGSAAPPRSVKAPIPSAPRRRGPVKRGRIAS